MNKNNDISTYENDLHELIHFLRTPFSTIKIGAEYIKEALPEIADFNNTASNKKLENSLLMIKNIILEVDKINEYVNKIINKKWS